VLWDFDTRGEARTFANSSGLPIAAVRCAGFIVFGFLFVFILLLFVIIACTGVHISHICIFSHVVATSLPNTTPYAFYRSKANIILVLCCYFIAAVLCVVGCADAGGAVGRGTGGGC
jgi:hypothetical protein